MTNPTLYPGDIASMSVSQLARLEPLQKHELKKNLLEASDFLKKQLAKLDAALEQAYSDTRPPVAPHWRCEWQGRCAPAWSGRCG